MIRNLRHALKIQPICLPIPTQHTSNSSSKLQGASMQASSKGKTSSTPEILWFMIVFNMKKSPMIGQTRFFSPEHKKEMRVKLETEESCSCFYMPKGCTSPVFAASGFSLNIPDQPIKSLDH
jgi:hypothetical protein